MEALAGRRDGGNGSYRSSWSCQPGPLRGKEGLVKAATPEVGRVGEGRRRWSGAVEARLARAVGGASAPGRRAAAGRAMRGGADAREGGLREKPEPFC